MHAYIIVCVVIGSSSSSAHPCTPTILATCNILQQVVEFLLLLACFLFIVFATTIATHPHLYGPGLDACFGWLLVNDQISGGLSHLSGWPWEAVALPIPSLLRHGVHLP